MEMNNGFSSGEDSRGPMDQMCCLIDDGTRCINSAGYASYSKRIQKTVTQRRLKLQLDTQARHTYICDYHKSRILARTKRRRKDSEDDSNETDTNDIPEIELYQLPIHALRRYKRYYKLTARPGLNKAQLAEVILEHFKQIPVKEKEVLTFFIYTVKSHSNKLDSGDR